MPFLVLLEVGGFFVAISYSSNSSDYVYFLYVAEIAMTISVDFGLIVVLSTGDNELVKC